MVSAEVNYPFSRQFSQMEAHTHQSVSWDLKSVVHSIDVYDCTYTGIINSMGATNDSGLKLN